MLFALAQAEVAAPIVQAAQPALNTLEKSIIGSLLIVSWAITGIVIWQLIKVQNARTAEQKEMREKSDDRTEKLVTTVADFNTTLKSQAGADESSRQVLLGIKQTLDLLLLLQGGRRLTPAAGTPAVPPAVPGKRGG